MNYYRTGHYNKLLKVSRQRGQVYYFPLRHPMDELNGFLKLGDFILSLNIFYMLSSFAQSDPFHPRRGEERASGREMSPARIGAPRIHLCRLLVSTFLFFLTLLIHADSQHHFYVKAALTSSRRRRNSASHSQQLEQVWLITCWLRPLQ